MSLKGGANIIVNPWTRPDFVFQAFPTQKALKNEKYAKHEDFR